MELQSHGRFWKFVKITKYIDNIIDVWKGSKYISDLYTKNWNDSSICSGDIVDEFWSITSVQEFSIGLTKETSTPYSIFILNYFQQTLTINKTEKKKRKNSIFDHIFGFFGQKRAYEISIFSHLLCLNVMQTEEK